jgi:formamidopyrimidine-DNA glycosylase
MPELPEVETVRRDLEKALLNDSALSVHVYDRRLMNKREEKLWQAMLPGQRWQGFTRRGKYLWIDLSNEWRLEFHLRMTGQLLVASPSAGAVPLPTGEGAERPGEAKSRLSINFSSGKTLRFCDQRRFGEAWLLPPGKAYHSKHPLGPDALSELRIDDFVKLVRSRTTRIQALLMDQHLLSGVGNIYAQEALFKAGIRPNRSGRRISKAEAARLFETLQETLQTAITHRGSTSRNYRDAYGEEGSAQTLHAVYRKGGKPCPHCKSSLKAARVGGRGTVYCAQCQK